MSEAKKKYPIPDDIQELDNKKVAHEQLRDLYAKLPFGFKKSFKCALQAENYRKQFWAAIYELYPELQGHPLRANESFVWRAE